MTPEQYEHRIAALGFENGTAWAEFVGIDRATHYRHLQRDDGPPKYLQHLVELLEVCTEEYAPKGVRLCPFKDAEGNTIKAGDTIRTESGLFCTVARDEPIREPEATLWYAAYDDGVRVRLEPLVDGRKSKAVVVEAEV